MSTPSPDRSDHIHSATILGRCVVHTLDDYRVGAIAGGGWLVVVGHTGAALTILWCTVEFRRMSASHASSGQPECLAWTFTTLHAVARLMRLPLVLLAQELELIRPQDYYSRFHFSVRTKVSRVPTALCLLRGTCCRSPACMCCWAQAAFSPACSFRPLLCFFRCNRTLYGAAVAPAAQLLTAVLVFVSITCLQKFGPDTVTVYCTCQMPENPDRSM